MSKGLRNYKEEDRAKVAQRRLQNNTKGLGYWGAYDYQNRKKKQ